MLIYAFTFDTLGYAWRAFCVGLMWGWFVTPIAGLPVPAFWHLVGLIALIDVLLVKAPGHYFGHATAVGVKNSLILNFINPALALSFGWLARVLTFN